MAFAGTWKALWKVPRGTNLNHVSSQETPQANILKPAGEKMKGHS
jgi:hypothetical protein